LGTVLQPVNLSYHQGTLGFLNGKLIESTLGIIVSESFSKCILSLRFLL